MSLDFLNSLLGYIIGGAALYAAIKSDLTRAIVVAEQAGKDAEKAHERLDNHISEHLKGAHCERS